MVISDQPTELPIPTPAFSIGQKIFVPWASAYRQKQITCPICFGKLYVTLILGSGEHVPISCEGCGIGYEGPTGKVTIYCEDSGINVEQINGMTLSGNKFTYNTTYRNLSPNEFFLTLEEAENHRKILLLQAEQQAQQSFESRFKQVRKSHAWRVRYHQNQIKDLERRIAYHQNKLTAKSTPEPAP